MKMQKWTGAAAIAGAAALVLAMTVEMPAQGPGGGKGKGGGKGFAPQTPRQAAPIDLTGYWVSLVTEDWLYRMVTPQKDAKGKADVASVPLTPAARQAADQWDPAKDEASGNVCKAYGPAGGMRLPTRLHIEWVDDDTLQVHLDNGDQKRMLEFSGDATGARSLQGFSKASWEGMGRGGRGTFGVPAGATGDANAPGAPGKQAVPIRPGALRVITTNLSGGYLRKNGVPYSENTTVSEWWDVVHQPDGTQYLILSTVVEDPANLTQPWRTSTHYKKEADGSKFKPQPCTAR